VSLAPCADLGADPRVKLTRDEAMRLVRSRPDVLGVTKIEAKLVLWAELEVQAESAVASSTIMRTP